MTLRLLLVSTGTRLYREYLLRSIASAYRVHLLTTAAPAWELPYLDGWTVVASTLDAATLVPAARAVHARDPLDGVLCWDEARILAATEVAAALGLPGDPAAVLRCRDKHRTREAFAAASVPQPRSVLVADLPEALAAADGIGYPVVLKPRALAASLGVVLVRDPAELVDRFAYARDTTAPGAPHHDAAVLVEEFADGPEISVDSVVHRGRVSPLCVAQKEIGYPPYFEEVGHVVDGADPLRDDPEVRALLHAAHAALGLTDGATHVELRRTATGPKVIEVNARVGGDLIPYLGLRASGIDPGLAAAAVACGLPPDPTPDRALVGAVRFCYAPEPLTIGAIGFDAAALPAAVDRAVTLVEPGASVAPPPAGTLWGRVALVTAFAGSAEECRTALDDAEAALRIEAVPVAPGTVTTAVGAGTAVGVPG